LGKKRYGKKKYTEDTPNHVLELIKKIKELKDFDSLEVSRSRKPDGPTDRGTQFRVKAIGKKTGLCTCFHPSGDIRRLTVKGKSKDFLPRLEELSDESR
jgi:hypothetical protein